MLTLRSPVSASHFNRNATTLSFFRRPRTVSSHGFTIVELLIVIVIIAILAAITIVAFTGVQNRARASAVSTALNQAKKKLEAYKIDSASGTYPTTGNLASAGITDSDTTYQYTSDGTSYCVTATNGSISYYLNSTTVASPTEGGCNGHTWPGGVVMTNLNSNSGFSAGTGGWASYNSSGSVTNGILTNTSSGVSINPSIYSNLSSGLTTGVKYYMATRVRVTNSSCLTLRTYTGASTLILVTSPTINTWYTPSVIFTASGDYAHNTLYHYYADAATASGKSMEVDWVTLIDLTATFGAGNEPTKAQMDAIMQRFPDGWFDGTVTANTVGIL